MTYGRINTPRFYVDANLLASTSGMINTDQSIDEEQSLFTLNPWVAKTLSIGLDSAGTSRYIRFGSNNSLSEASKIVPSLDWLGILGIKKDIPNREIQFSAAGYSQSSSDGDYTSGGDISFTTDVEAIYGAESISGNSGNAVHIQNGYFLARFNNNYINALQERFTVFSFFLTNRVDEVVRNVDIGSYCCGWSYAPSTNPDLSVTETFQQDGVSKMRTIGGKDLSQINHTGCPQWVRNGLMPFQRSNTINTIAPGDTASYLRLRKKWSISFSYVADTKLKPSSIHDNVNNTINAPFTSEIKTATNTETGATQDYLSYTGISDDFISKVWYGTMSGALPFIFQPNQDVEEFHIVKFVNNTIQFNQVAVNTFNVSFELEEVW